MVANLPNGQVNVKGQFAHAALVAPLPVGQDCPGMTDNQIRAHRKARGFTIEDLSARAGISVSYLSRLERGQKTLSVTHIDKLARALDVPREQLIAQGEALTAPVVGYVGAGNEAHYYDLADSAIDEAPMPPGGTEKTVAVVVRGDSMMGWADDGDLIFFEDVRSPVTDDLIGKRCVVGTTDGRILVKRLARRIGDPNRFILTSYNAETLVDVPLAWAARVTAIVPR